MLLLRKWGGFTRSDVVFVALSYYRSQKQQTCSKPGTSDSDNLNKEAEKL